MLEIVLAVVLGLLAVYLFNQMFRSGRYWERRGIKTLRPVPLFGNSFSVITGKKHVAEMYIELLKAYPDEQILGYYDLLMKPRLLIHDKDYVEKILIKDFAHFADRTPSSEGRDPTSIDTYQLFAMTGSKWRAFRYKLTPLFTSGKLKYMYQNYDIVGEKLLKYFETHPKKEVILKDVMHLYSMDFVGRAIFGLNTSCLENPNSEYHRMGVNVFDVGVCKMLIMSLFPSIWRKLGLSFNNQAAVKYFCKVIEDTFNYRKENNITRNDFIQMMMDLKEKGKIEIQKWDPNDNYLKEENGIPKDSFEITDISLMSQAYTFMTTGLDGVALACTHSFYELSLHQDIQDKVRAEILEQIKVHSGLTYDALNNMTYLGSVINEAMRLYPVAQTLFRVCTKDYTFPNGFTVKAGDEIQIPMLAIQRNPNIHTDPNTFKPERFEVPMKPGTYFPFGDGPRICIAMRFALLQIKYALARTLSKYKVRLSRKTVTPIKMKAISILYEPQQTLYFDLEEI